MKTSLVAGSIAASLATSPPPPSPLNTPSFVPPLLYLIIGSLVPMTYALFSVSKTTPQGPKDSVSCCPVGCPLGVYWASRPTDDSVSQTLPLRSTPTPPQPSFGRIIGQLPVSSSPDGKKACCGPEAP